MLHVASKDAQEREAIARLGGYVSWAHEVDPSARTAPARAAFMRRFERQVDPDGVLPEHERRRRAESARRAYYTQLSIKAQQARRARRVERPRLPSGQALEELIGRLREWAYRDNGPKDPRTPRTEAQDEVLGIISDYG